MRRRSFLQTAGAASVASGGRAAETRPNILFIVGDNQQWGTIANRSQCRTPHINRLAGQGMNFTCAHTTAGVCSPARNALLTGSFPWAFRTFNHPDNSSAVTTDMAPDVVTYAMRMKEAGYRMGYNGKWHSSVRRIPTDLGYTDIGAPKRYKDEALKKVERLGLSKVRADQRLTNVRVVSWPGSKPWGIWGYTEGKEEETENHIIADTGIQMMKRFAGGNQPWMVEIHFPEASRAWPLRKYRQRYDARDIPVAKNFHENFDGKPNMVKREALAYGPMTEDDFREGRAFYYASFEQLDTQVGRILQALDETGQAGRTLVIYASDHGAPWGAHRLWFPCFAPYEELYKVPMVMRWPGRIQPGTVCDKLVQFHDLAHTFIDMLGLKPLPHRHGVSIMPLFEDPKRSGWRDMIQCSWWGQNYLLQHWITTTPRYKYVFNGFDFDECYDLVNDPDELRNLVNQPAAASVVADMQARTYELMSQYGDPFGDTSWDARWHAQRYLPRGRRMR